MKVNTSTNNGRRQPQTAAPHCRGNGAHTATQPTPAQLPHHQQGLGKIRELEMRREQCPRGLWALQQLPVLFRKLGGLLVSLVSTPDMGFQAAGLRGSLRPPTSNSKKCFCVQTILPGEEHLGDSCHPDTRPVRLDYVVRILLQFLSAPRHSIGAFPWPDVQCLTLGTITTSIGQSISPRAVSSLVRWRCPLLTLVGENALAPHTVQPGKPQDFPGPCCVGSCL
ncbi:hypothetical protein VULLAG_LOCUS16516 [Vulpes lagopus]